VARRTPDCINSTYAYYLRARRRVFETNTNRRTPKFAGFRRNKTARRPTAFRDEDIFESCFLATVRGTRPDVKYGGGSKRSLADVKTTNSSRLINGRIVAGQVEPVVKTNVAKTRRARRCVP